MPSSDRAAGTLRYRVFDFCIESELPLPGLEPCEMGEPDWRFSMLESAPDRASFERFHDWRNDNRQVVMSGFRSDDRYLLEFAGLGAFIIDFSGRCIGAFLGAGCNAATAAHLLLDQVLPRAVCHEGVAVLHASAVRLRDGRIVAFSGPSGRGKSTLALAFYQAGHEVITDDCLMLKTSGDRVAVRPAYRSLRLWADSLEALPFKEGESAPQVSLMAHYTDKRQLFFDLSHEFGTARASSLEALFILAEPGGQATGQDAVSIEPIRGSRAAMALIEAMFDLDVAEPSHVRASFETATRLANQVQIYALNFPRRYRNLAQVIDKITKFR